MSLSMFEALPAYFGGKRRLVGEIFRYLPSPAEAPVLADAFLGGGSVSLYAKAKGYRVICNDIAERSHIVGKALIENSQVKIDAEDVERLVVPCPESGNYVLENFSPDVLTRKQAKFVDLALHHARSMPEPKRWLMQLLIVKYVIRMRPMGNFGAKSIMRQLDAEDWESIKPSYVRDILSRRGASFPYLAARDIAKEINKGVFSNALGNQAHRMDVFEFLEGVKADIVYFDPPYAGTMAYETSLKPLDDLLRGHAQPVEKSVFSGPQAIGFLQRMFESAQHIPIWALSYGNAAVGLEDLTAIMCKYRPNVMARELHHIHCTGLASAASKAANREFILIGRRS